MPLYVCRAGGNGHRNGRPTARLSESRPLRDYDKPPADVPLVSHLITLL